MANSIEGKLRGTFSEPIIIKSFSDLCDAPLNKWIVINGYKECKLEQKDDFSVGNGVHLLVNTYSKKGDYFVKDSYSDFYRLNGRELSSAKSVRYLRSTDEGSKIYDKLKASGLEGDLK
jgi:hypothetical protein